MRVALRGLLYNLYFVQSVFLHAFLCSVSAANSDSEQIAIRRTAARGLPVLHKRSPAIVLLKSVSRRTNGTQKRFAMVLVRRTGLSGCRIIKASL
jgi:hypothetical protein